MVYISNNIRKGPRGQGVKDPRRRGLRVAGIELLSAIGNTDHASRNAESLEPSNP
jgi:hypothetical protein